MKQKVENYQKWLDDRIESLKKEEKVKRLLLHSCCAPCSSYVLEYLAQYFSVSIFYYNPNITIEEEYKNRIEEQKRLIKELPVKYPISFLEGEYFPEKYFETVKGYEKEKEGGERCFLCYELRLREAAEVAKKGKFDYFTTTLSISPMKNAKKLNEIGERLSLQYGIPYLYSDFKKKGGYQRSIALSKEYHLYRQNYCGCIFSKKEAEERELKKMETEREKN